MAWIKVRPENSGGKKKNSPPAATVYAAGALVLTHGATELLGEPAKVRIEINPDEVAIRVFPATPGDMGAFSLAGGGNAQHRASFRAVLSKYPQFAGSYKVLRIAGGIECRRQSVRAEDDA